MNVFRGMRTAALFVGSVVGAGFATGREVSLFFGGDGVGSLVVASLFMAVCAYAFLDMGARQALRDPRLLLATDGVIALSSFAVYAAMIAAAEGVLRRLTGAEGLSLPLTLLVMTLAGKRLSWVSLLNLVAVPLMVAVIMAVGLRVTDRIAGDLHPLRAMAYGGMNLLFSGALMIREGETLTMGGRLTASLTAGGTIFVMLLFMRRCVAGTGSAEMPFLEVAAREGVGTLASLVLLLAIVTTMASTAYLVTERLTALTGDGVLSASLTTLAGYLTSTVGFAPLVAYTYPVVSYLGLASTLAALALVFLPPLFRRFGKRGRRRVPADS